PALGFPDRAPSAFNLKLNPRQTYLDRLTKWPGKSKAVEHAQQNVKTGCAPRSLAGSATGRLKVLNYPYFRCFVLKIWPRLLGKRWNRGKWTLQRPCAGAIWTKHIPPAAHPAAKDAF